jgi:uncharacterized protein (TIGR02118 family)
MLGPENAMKVIFVIYKRKGLTHEESLAQWNEQRHTSIVRRLPGLLKWVQNHAAAARGESAADGVGEMWFDSVEAMETAMRSPEMVAAVEDAERFLDMEKTYAVIVDEKTVVG